MLELQHDKRKKDGGKGTLGKGTLFEVEIHSVFIFIAVPRMAGMTRTMRVPAMTAVTAVPRMAPMAMMMVVMVTVTVTVTAMMIMFTIIVLPLVILHFVLQEVSK